MAKKKKTPEAPTLEKDIAQEIIPRNISDYLENENLAYQIYTINNRAIPDIFSGVKPGARRLLYSMYKNNLLPGKKPQKSSKIVSAVTGEYHPHGQTAMYGALASLAVPYGRVPLIDGIGAFGRSPGDTPAADRYTEARLSEPGLELVKELADGGSDMQPTYDKETIEPVFLPARFPVFLCLGAEGISEGWSTNTPSHNPLEVLDAVELVLDNDKATVEDIFDVMPGPDFGTGGTIIGSKDGILDYYATGRGKMIVQGSYEVKGKTIIINEMPPSVGVETFLSGTDGNGGLKGDTKNGKIAGISDISNYSDYENGTHIEIKVKRGWEAEKVAQEILKKTPLETAYHASVVALGEDMSPQWWGIKEILDTFIDYRHKVIKRISDKKLENLEEKLEKARAEHVVSLNKEEVTEIIMSSDDKSHAARLLRDRFELTEFQGDFVVSLPLHRLTKADQIEVEKKLQELEKDKKHFEGLSESKRKRKTLIKKQLKEVRKVFESGDFSRRTTLDFSAEPATSSQSSGPQSQGDYQKAFWNNWRFDPITVSVGPDGDKINENNAIFVLTNDGRIKKFLGKGLPLSVSQRPIMPDVNATWGSIVARKDTDIAIFTAGIQGEVKPRVTRFHAEDFDDKGATAGGNIGIRLDKGDKIIAMIALPRDDKGSILVESDTTYKTMSVSEIPVKSIGIKGQIYTKLPAKAKKAGETITQVTYSPSGFSRSGKALPEKKMQATQTVGDSSEITPNE